MPEVTEYFGQNFQGIFPCYIPGRGNIPRALNLGTFLNLKPSSDDDDDNPLYLPGEEHQREVPGNNGSNHTDTFPTRQRVLFFVKKVIVNSDYNAKLLLVR